MGSPVSPIFSSDIIDPKQAADAFLKVADQFRLGVLPTEQRHPKTMNLADDARKDVAKAIEILKEVDLDALQILNKNRSELHKLQAAIKRTIANGNKIFLCGCGATGRLSLTLEVLWRQQATPDKIDTVVGFMAGGDLALIRSVENFEDSPEFGARQLIELGFKAGDLLISSTEGGETSFVIGATEYAASLVELKEPKAQPPYFLYCNPDDILSKYVERSKRVIESPLITKLNLFVGPMALSGSTRMQCSTVQLAAIGVALLFEDVNEAINEITTLISQTDFLFLAPFIEKEAALCSSNGTIYYDASENLGISVLTDTTERCPTFSLSAFDNAQDVDTSPSLSYLLFSQQSDSKAAWNRLLLRNPRALDWREHYDRVSLERLLGYDFSSNVVERRQKAFPHLKPVTFEVKDDGSSLILKLENLSHRILWEKNSSLARHLLLKLLLNTHSTLVMGRLNRYESNVMVWVRASNYKLIDRAVRYIEALLEREGNTRYSYSDLVHECFHQMDTLGPTESIVLKTVDALR